MVALADALRAMLDGRRLVAAISILDDKDAAEMLRALLPLCAEVITCANANPRALSPATLQSLVTQLGGPAVRTIADPHAALERGAGGGRPRRRRAGHRLDLPGGRPARDEVGRPPGRAVLG